MKDKDTQSEEFEARVERLSLGGHTEGSPEMAHRPVQTGAVPPGTYNVTFVPNQYMPPPAPYYQQPTIINTVSALTEERVRAIFREEIAKWEQDLAKRMRMQGKPAWWV